MNLKWVIDVSIIMRFFISQMHSNKRTTELLLILHLLGTYLNHLQINDYEKREGIHSLQILFLCNI